MHAIRYSGNRELIPPSGIWPRNDVVLTSMRRNSAVSTSVWRRYDVMCPPGLSSNSPYVEQKQHHQSSHLLDSKHYYPWITYRGFSKLQTASYYTRKYCCKSASLFYIWIFGKLLHAVWKEIIVCLCIIKSLLNLYRSHASQMVEKKFCFAFLTQTYSLP